MADYTTSIIAFLRLKAAAFLDVGTAPGTVAAGDDTRLTSLKSAAFRDVGTTAGTVAAADDSRLTSLKSAAFRDVGAASGTVMAGDDIRVTDIASSGAWTPYGAAIAAAGGSLGAASANARYKKIGRMVFVSMTATITDNGTGAGTVNVSMPFAAASNVGLPGREFTNTGFSLAGVMLGGGSTLFITNYDGSYPAPAAGTTTLVITGAYEAST